MSREILAPPLQRMGKNRCYRVNLVHEDFGGSSMARTTALSQSQVGYTEPDLFVEDDEDNTYHVEELPNSFFRLAMHVAPAFYGGIIGFKGSTKKRIEAETRTEINVPRSRVTGGTHQDLTVQGQSRRSVLEASRKINLLIASLRQRIRPTHFVGLPLSMSDIKEKFQKFKKEILAQQFPGIDELLFQGEGRLHLTLCVCVLLDDQERTKAAEILKDCREFLVDVKTPFEIKISGLEIMNDDPSAVRILYAVVESTELQQFADRVYNSFFASGFCTEKRDHVKLHMTILRVKNRKKVDATSAGTFDARGILKHYGDFQFGTASCCEMQLCVIGSKDEKEDCYKVAESITLWG